MIVLKPNMFYAPSNYRRDRCNVPAENGDYTIEIPSLEFGEESYASLNIVGRQLHDDEGLHFGYIELVGLKVLCKRGKPLYYGLNEPKIYEYCLSLYLHDVNDEWQTYDLHGTDICFLLYTILPLLNLALKDGCLISHLNFDWLEWQCNAWEWGEANGQGRGFLLMRTISTTWRVFTDTSNLLRLRQSNNPYTKEVEVYIGLMSVFVLDILITTFLT